MNVEAPQSPGRELPPPTPPPPAVEDVAQRTEVTSEAEKPPRQNTSESPKTDAVDEPMEYETDQTKELERGGEPPVDWFEPLEEDDDTSVGLNDLEDESIAGETESVAGSDIAFKRMNQLPFPRRRRSRRNEGWVECAHLGEGWKRKEVVRRSGSSVGQKDVYYLSPQGDRVRSRVELATMLEGILDLAHFDYKSGNFYDGVTRPIRVRNRTRRKTQDHSSSESSWMERGEGADTPDSLHRLTPKTPTQGAGANTDECPEEKIKLPLPSSSKPQPLPSINGEIGTEDSTLICARCGISFTGTWYDKQRKRPCCPNCWASKTKEHPMIRFRKWIPCGQCVRCHNTDNCGQCVNCKYSLQSPESRRRLCWKRKCICPIRRGSGSEGLQKKPYVEIPEILDDSFSFQQSSLKSSDTENVSANMDYDDDEDLSTDDDDDWHKKRKRRSCGECKACLCRKDCGTCDFCIDKPKFGGSNKKRQKCRLRQCQRQAMMAQGGFATDIPGLPGRQRPHYTYSRKSNMRRNKASQLVDVSDIDDDDSNLPAVSWRSEPLSGSSKFPYETDVINHQLTFQSNHTRLSIRNGLSDRGAILSNHNSSHPDQDSRLTNVDDERPLEEEDELPMITQIFSLADNPLTSSMDAEDQLIKLLNSIRTTTLPILWYAILVEGPQLQLIQCSKQSNMVDTIVTIDPDFLYQVSVQKQPLLPTHRLYDDYPARMNSVTEVVNLLLGLEKFVVCQGLPPKEPSSKEPVMLQRATTCDFLVTRKEGICSNCRMLQE